MELELAVDPYKRPVLFGSTDFNPPFQFQKTYFSFFFILPFEDQFLPILAKFQFLRHKCLEHYW